MSDCVFQRKSVIDGRFKVNRLIGKGGRGEVYHVSNMVDGKNYALKAEIDAEENDNSVLTLEYTVLGLLQKFPHFARFHYAGRTEKAHFFVMQLMGPNLSQLRRTSKGRKFTESTSLRVGLSCLDAIQELHSIGLLHRDIKPANFAVDLEQEIRSGNIYLLDFGSVRRFRMKNGKLREPRKVVIFRGTVKYGSANALSCFESGCHDDLISWFYMVAEFLKGRLPWSGKSDMLEINLIKLMNEKALSDGLTDQMKQICKSLYKLKYEDQPDYEAYRSRLLEILTKKRYLIAAPYDWEMAAENHRLYASLFKRFR